MKPSVAGRWRIVDMEPWTLTRSTFSDPRTSSSTERDPAASGSSSSKARLTFSLVLVVRPAKNHPLPDGNKRAAGLPAGCSVDLNGWSWHPKPEIGDAEQAVLAIASGEWDEEATAGFGRLRPGGPRKHAERGPSGAGVEV